jgi:translation initiation factor IF-1
VTATVVEERPSLVFEVVLESQHRVLAHLVGNEKRNFVRLVPGDRVEVELSPHDPTRGRILRKVNGA